jgi:hypothetical protein
MLDMPLEEERRLLAELWRRTYAHPDPDDSCVIDGDEPWECPRCHKGQIRTTCYVERRNGEGRSWRYDHRCDSCGEALTLSSLQAEVKLRESVAVLRSMETPFGTFHALVGETELPFVHRVSSCDLGDEFGEVLLHEMDVDVSGCFVGDVVSCRFEEAHLEFIDSDERVEFRCGVNDGFAMEVSGYNPEFDIYRGTSYARELEKFYPYDLQVQTLEGFDYIIERDPKGYDPTAYYWSTFISLAAAWLPKPYESFTFDDEAGGDLDDRLSAYWP